MTQFIIKFVLIVIYSVVVLEAQDCENLESSVPYVFYTPDHKILGQILPSTVKRLSKVIKKNKNFDDAYSLIIDIKQQDSEYPYLPRSIFKLFLEYLKANEYKDNELEIKSILKKIEKSKYALYLLQFAWIYKFKELQKMLAPCYIKAWKQLLPKSRLEDFIENNLGDKAEFRSMISNHKPFFYYFYHTVKDVLTHSSLISCITLSNRYLVSGDHSGQIKLYNLKENTVKNAFTHNSPITNIIISKNKEIVVSLSKDNIFKIYTIETGVFKEFIYKNANITCLALNEEYIACGDCKGRVSLYELKTGLVKDIIKFDNKVSCLALNDKYLVSGDYYGDIKLYNIENNTLKNILTHSEYITCIKINNKYVALGSKDGLVKLYDLKSEAYKDIIKFDNKVSCLALNDKYLASGDCDGHVKLYNLKKNISKTIIICSLRSHVNNIALYDNHIICSTENGEIKLYANNKVKNIYLDTYGSPIIDLSEQFIAFSNDYKSIKMAGLVNILDDNSFFKFLEQVN